MIYRSYRVKKEKRSIPMKTSLKKVMITTTLAGVMALSAGDLFARGYGRGDCPGRGYDKNHRGPGPGHFFKKLDMLKVELGLTDDQVKKLFDIHQKYQRKFFENRTSVDRILELRAEKHKEMKKIMTAEQQKKFDGMFLNRGPRGKRGSCDGFRGRRR